MQNHTIRKFRAEDYAAWKSLYSDCPEFWHAPLPEDRLTEIWGLISGGSPSIQGLALFDGKNLIGFAHYVLWPHLRTMRFICYIMEVYVVPASRRQGVARALFHHLTEKGRAENWFHIFWKTDPDNGAAQKLYDSIAPRDEAVYYKLKLG